MHLDFPEELITGIEKIDSQHMELFAKIKTMHESYLNGTNAEKLIETFVYIKNYINEHFLTEEKYMKENNYPYIENHLKSHKDFFDNYCNLEKIFNKDGLSSDFSLDFNVNIIKWLEEHVLKEDIVLADFIHQKNKI